MKQNYFIGTVILFLIISANSFAQIPRYRGLWTNPKTHVKYFVAFDPSTSKKTLIKTFPGNIYISQNIKFNYDENIFAFEAGNSNYSGSGILNWYYYLVNAQTGNILSTSPYNNVFNIEYNPFNKTYIGLWWHEPTYNRYVVSLNPVTSSISLINTNPIIGPSIVYYSAFDTDSNRYFFIGSCTASPNSYCYYLIDAQTGAIISTSPYNQIKDIAYSPFLKKYIGLWKNELTSEVYYVSFNPSTSDMTLISSIPEVMQFNPYECGFVFNTDNNQYLFVGGKDYSFGPLYYYYVLDGLTGTIISKSSYNDVSSIFYINNSTVGIDQQNSIPNSVSVYPNPALTTVNIELPEVTSSYQIQFFNTLGQKVIDKENNLERITAVDVESLPCGMYSILIKMDEKVVCRKFMKQ